MYTNVTCSDIDKSVQSGKVDIDTVQGFEGIKPWIEMKQADNEKELI
jgi:hypothetical protein